MKTTPDEAPLGRLKAIIDALCDRPIDFYPQVDDASAIKSFPTRDVMKEFGDRSRGWLSLSPGDDLDQAVQLAQASLSEVKAQTEYQDQKATRLLTVATFLLALAGALFTRLYDAFPIPLVKSLPIWEMVLIGTTYLGFGLFLMLSIFGAMVTYHATRTRFKYARDGQAVSGTGVPRSRLFYQGIIGVRPSAWSEAFVDDASGTPKLREDLQQHYLRDLVGETYLVACKTADKLRYLDPAQRLLSAALKVLIIWFALLAVLACLSVPKASEPTSMKILQGDAPLAVRVTGAPVTGLPVADRTASTSDAASVAASTPGHTEGTKSRVKAAR